MAQRVMMSIHDDQTGEGPDIAFPTMSTCAAVICVLANRLVGVHKTRGWNGNTTKLFTHATRLINGDAIRSIYIAGWNASDATAHDTAAITAALNAANVPTWVCDFDNATVPTPSGGTNMAYEAGFLFKATPTTDLCTFAFHKGTNEPKIAVKRTTKVTLSNLDVTTANANRGVHGHDARFLAVNETLTTPSDHLHGLRKHLEFSRA